MRRCVMAIVGPCALVASLGLSAGALAGASSPVDALRAGQDVSFDIRAASVAATGSFVFNEPITDEDAPPICAPKARGSLSIVLDLADFGFPASIPVTLTGTELSPTRVRWDADVLVNQCVPATLPDGTTVDILIRRVVMRLTGDISALGATFDTTCAQRRGVLIQTTGGDAANFVNVEAYGLCVVFPFTRVDVAVRDLVADGRAADDPCPADTNADNVVNFADLNAVLSEFGLAGAPGDFLGDVNADGVVNFADLNAVLSAFGTSCAG